MIIYKNLGRNGRLGNQLFQIAATLAHANKMMVPALFNHWDYNKYMKHPLCTMADNFPSDYEYLGIRHNDYLEKGFHYEPIPDDQNLILNGYFQSEKYFKEQVEIIRDIFNDLLDNYPMYYKIYSDRVAIHVRRGDYLAKEQYHPVLPDHYYENAIKAFLSNYDLVSKLLIFTIYSDDIEYCRTMDVFKPGNIIPEEFPIEFIAKETHDKAGIPFELHTMGLLSRCQHHIIANSSYSWWVAFISGSNWLQSSQFIYAPSPWFGPACNHRTDDIYCDGWKIINYLK